MVPDTDQMLIKYELLEDPMVSRCTHVVTTQRKRKKSLRRGNERHITGTLVVTTQRKHPESLRRGSRSCDNDDNCEALCAG